MQRLLGEEAEQLPKTGHNIQVAYTTNDMKDGEFVSKMASELNYVFPSLSGKIQDFQNDKMGIFMINVDDEHFDVVKKYLDAENMRWAESYAFDSTEDEKGSDD